VVFYQLAPLSQQVKELQGQVASDAASLEGLHTSAAALTLTLDTIDSEVQKTLEQLANDVNIGLSKVEEIQEKLQVDIEELYSELGAMKSDVVPPQVDEPITVTVKPIKKSRKRKKS
jgi:ABC-type transporter Mla subunit MlaD